MFQFTYGRWVEAGCPHTTAFEQQRVSILLSMAIDHGDNNAITDILAADPAAIGRQFFCPSLDGSVARMLPVDYATAIGKPDQAELLRSYPPPAIPLPF